MAVRPTTRRALFAEFANRAADACLSHLTFPRLRIPGVSGLGQAEGASVVVPRVPTASRGRLVRLLGPAFVAAVAYVDPGNVAANVSVGARYGYGLLWVLVAANVMAVVVQYMSAKVGLVTGRSLPELLGERLPGTARLPFWVQAEIVAAATDLAEVVGGAIALQLLFGLPLLAGGILVSVVSIAVLRVQTCRGQRTFEFVIMGFLLVITVGFVAGLFFSPADLGAAASGLQPRFEDSRSVLLAASIIGATVMPHAIYAHSDLARRRHGRSSDVSQLRRLLRATRWDVGVALVVAGGVNIAMMLLAASALPGVAGTDTIDGAANAISDHLGAMVGVAFGVGLLASSLASTSVGAYAGSSIMAGLLKVQVPVVIRRTVTVIPALIVLAVGADPTWALVLSQVVLSVGIPFALVPLVIYSSSRRVMGQFASRRVLVVVVAGVAGAIIVLNAVLLYLLVTGRG